MLLYKGHDTLKAAYNISGDYLSNRLGDLKLAIGDKGCLNSKYEAICMSNAFVH
jgi:hypothetical protein